MKTQLLALVSLLALATTACGAAIRSPEMYRDDTAKVFESKTGDMKACYDDVLKGKPGAGGTVTVKFTWSSEDGTLKDTAVDPAGSSAPAEIQACVTKALTGLTIDPKDAKDGQGSWKFDFHAPPPAAAPPAAPPT